MHILSIIIIITFSACSSLKHPFPPDPKFISSVKSNLTDNITEKKDLEQNESWAKEYIKAKYNMSVGKNDLACDGFKKLQSDIKFPLKSMAFVRSIELCDFSNNELEVLWKTNPVKIPGWARKIYIETSLKVAKKNRLPKLIAKFSAEFSKYKRLKNNRISLIKKAIRISKKLNDQKSEAKYQKQLHDLAPRFNSEISDQNIYEIARDFERNRQFRKARRLYRKIIKNDNQAFSEKVKAWNRIRFCYKNQRNRKQFLKQTKKLAFFIKTMLKREPKNSEYINNYISMQIKLARALWTSNKLYQAENILFDLLKFGVYHNRTRALIYKIVGSIALERKELSVSLGRYYLSESLSKDNKSFYDEIRWCIGWNLYLMNRFTEAAEKFETLNDDTDSFFLKLKLDYWEAEALLKTGETTRAEELLNELTKKDSFGYYGIMAHRKLKIPFQIPTFNPSDEPRELHTFEWLKSMGESETATTYLRRYSYSVTKPDEIEPFILLHHPVGIYDFPIHLFFKIPPENREEVLQRNASLVFPFAYKDTIEKVAARFDLRPELIYSIIRQESTFNRFARSPADAYGLMQLIPKRAHELSYQYNVRYNNLSDLFNPQINLFMGSALLKKLVKKNNGHFISTVSYYNARPEVVERWKANRFCDDQPKSIEMIPYTETKLYSKLILRNMITYMRLEKKEPFLFPEDIFTDL